MLGPLRAPSSPPEMPAPTKEYAMPGGRLTQQERRQIARGLADGLA
ncbi:MarR family transcriptional regulator, partial [Streptomyces sp. NPDC057927]